jgi:Phenol hydroxylase conserved region
MAAGNSDVMVSVGEYPLRQQDTEDRFYGKRLIYLGWDHHLMFSAPFCVPLPPTLPFGALVHEVLPEVFGEHPEFERIDWQRTPWRTTAWSTSRSSAFARPASKAGASPTRRAT